MKREYTRYADLRESLDLIVKRRDCESLEQMSLGDDEHLLLTFLDYTDQETAWNVYLAIPQKIDTMMKLLMKNLKIVRKKEME